MLDIFFAPLQGYTDDVYRRVHYKLIGGVKNYYTPFVRIEAGAVRSKDQRDIAPENNNLIAYLKISAVFNCKYIRAYT